MSWTEKERLPSAVLPMAELGDFLHLRADATGQVRQDPQLEAALRAAILEIESQTGRVLLRRKFVVQGANVEADTADHPIITAAWRGDEELPVDTFTIKEHIEPKSLAKQCHFEILAGQEHWDAVSGDLQSATLSLAGFIYRQRFEGHDEPMPVIVERLIAKHRKLRIWR